MAHRTKVSALIILVLIQVSDLTAEKMSEAPADPRNSNSEHVEQELIVNLNEQQFEDFVKAPHVRIVYFNTIDFSGLRNFLRELKSTAALLAPFKVKMGKVDCKVTKVPEYCNMPDVHNSVYAFKNGGELLELMLVNMFDVNSMMSNILQLVLLKEVPILQTKEERVQFEDANKGKLDVIFSYQRSIGTYEHRILMEIAHGYNGSFAFALTTEEEVIDDLPLLQKDEDVALWVGHCKEAKEDEPCEYNKYHDAMEISHLSRFLRYFNIRLLHNIDSNKARNPLADFDVHVAVLFHDKASKENVAEIAEDVNAAFQGTLGVITVDLDNVEGSRFGYVKDLTALPGLAVFIRDEQTPYYLETSLSSETAVRFVRSELDVYASKKRKKNPAAKAVNHARDEIAAVEKQDDAVAEAVFQLKGTPINRDHLPALTDKTFPQATGSHDVLMVLFYLTFDARSMAFIRSYAEAAELLAKDGVKPLAAVDCYDWTDVCGKQNITSYPTIRIYRKGQGYTTYKGALDTEVVTMTAKLLLTQAPLLLQSESEVSSFLDGSLPSGIGALTPISILGLFTAEQKTELQGFTDASQELHGKYLMGYAAEKLTSKLLSTYKMKGPGFVVFNRADPYKPQKVYEGDMSAEKVMDAISDAVLPVLPELTALSFPTYFAMGQPLAILFVKGKGDEEEKKIMKTMAEISLNKDGLGVVLCWMKVDESDPLNVGSSVLKEYNPAAVAPALALVNHATGDIFNYPKAEFKQEDILRWVESTVDGSLAPSKKLSEKEWKPLNPGYDFLAMIDQENEGNQNERDRFRKSQRDKEMDEMLSSRDPMEAVMDSHMDDEMESFYDKGKAPSHTEL